MTEKLIATPVFTRQDEYLDDTHDIIDANGMAIGVSVSSHSLEQVVKAVNMHTELVEALEESLMFADKIAEDYIKLSEMLERKNITTPSPLIVIGEMHNHLVEVAEKALKATKEG